MAVRRSSSQVVPLAEASVLIAVASEHRPEATTRVVGFGSGHGPVSMFFWVLSSYTVR